MLACPSCGSENAAGAKFCSECGSRLDAAAQPLEERKVVSVVFCDLVGSTARAERLDPEDVRAELSSYHARVRSELERHGGTVEKFIGDAVVAVFGAPLVHEDDAERAVRAALAIRDWALEEERVDVRVAVNTGEALVTLDASAGAGEGLVAGDVVNTAARLQTAAPVNGVLVGEKTYGATRHRIDYRERVDIDAKGKQDPVPAWEAVASRSLLGVDVDVTPMTRLVGRRRELDVLLDALARARAEREPQLVTIVGVPGMGKSRLVQELSVVLEAEPELVRWRQGRSLPYGEGIAYWALGEMVKGEAGILESDAAEVAESKLRETVARVGGEGDADWLRGLLLPLLGIAEDSLGGDRRADAFVAWRRFLEALAEESPTVLVFEDLHWADDGLLDFVDTLIDWATDVPLLVVGTARPELLARRSHWGGGKTNSTTLSLSPLTEVETAELVHTILERSVLPADVQAAVLARAGGNPLYAEEFARIVAERAPEDVHDLDLPDSVQGLIASRLDALPRAEKEVLQDASVVGKVFWPGALESVRPEQHALQDALGALERKEFVRRERRSSVEGELQYAFRHVLVRDVAYGQLPRAARAAKHEQVALWIDEHVRSEDAAELLAYHYSSALEYSRALRQTVPSLAARARAALRDAGRRAVALNAFANAVRYYEAAVELTPEESDEWPRLALEYAEAATYVDLSSDRLLLRARDRLLDGDIHDAVRTEMVLGEYRWLRGEQREAEEAFQKAERLAEQMIDQQAKLHVLAMLTRFAMLADANERAVSLGENVLRLAEELGRDDIRASVLNSVGVARASLGDAAGLEELEESLAITHGVGAEHVRATGNLASVLVTLGQLDRAATLHREALQAAREIGYEEPTRWLATEVAIDLVVVDGWKEARRIVDELIPGYETSPFWIEPQTRVCRARMLFAEGALAEALEDADRAVDLVRDSHAFQSICEPFAFRASVHAELGELEEAAALLDELLDTWIDLHSGYVGWWLLDLWAASAATGREERLQAAIDGFPVFPWLEVTTALIQRDFDSAVDRLDQIGATSRTALVRLWAGERLVEQGRQADANVHLERSRDFWRSVGAQRYVDRCSSLLAGGEIEEGSFISASDP